MREQVTEADDTVIEWIYDNLNRLEQENRVGSYTHDYTYDLVGNRVKLDDGSSVNYYQYNEMDQLLAESPNPDYTNPTITYGYDENGSLTSKTASGQTTVYGYNLQNRMASVTVGANPAISYKYNPDGIRVSAGNTSYLINPYNPTGYAQVFRETTGSTATIYTIGNDIITQAADTSQPQYFLYDGQGSVRHLTDDTGAIISGQNYNYDAYGSRTDSSTVQTEILYTGQWYDFDSDQYYLRARWYDSSNGRFNRLDPFMGNRWDPQSLHRYLYVYNNPINSTDPYGLFTLSDISHAISIGSKIYNFVDISLSVKKYAKEFTEGVSLGQIAFDAGLNIAVNYAGGKMLEKIIDVAGPAARKFTEKATKRVRKKLCDAHHIIPKFLQGDPSGALAGLTPEMHTKYHKMLKEKLETKFGRKFGGWSTNLEWEQFLSDPLKRMQAAEVLIDTATNLDDELGGDVLTSALLKELSDQDYFIGN
jgi:RHS repeat-associated protein